MSTNSFDRELPQGLEGLVDLATDLRWTGSLLAQRIWKKLDPEAWERCNNPYTILMNVHQERLEEAARDRDLNDQLAQRMARRKNYLERKGWYGERFGHEPLKGVAYFSMEFGLSEALPIYSGGLGILAGDHLKSASDLGVPVIGIGLLYQQGYYRQVIGEDGQQHEAFPYNDPGSLPIRPVRGPDGRWPRVRFELPGRELLIRVWEAKVGKVTLYLLDTNDPGNNPWDRAITAHLYAAGQEIRLLQELVLGIGGWRLMEKLGLEPEICHLNEGHAAFAVLARAQSHAQKHGVPFPVALRETRPGNVFTTHTPVEAAFDRFPPALLAKYAQPFVEKTGMPLDAILALGRRNPDDAGEPFNMAYLAMRGCSRANGVARLHGKVSRKLFNNLFPNRPEAEVPVSHVTNGVHVPTWDGEAANDLWSRSFSNNSLWLENLGQASHSLLTVSETDLWNFRAQARMNLVEYVRRRLERQVRESGQSQEAIHRARHVLDPNVLTLGFARRFAPYKRPTLLLHDQARLLRLLRDARRPVQIVLAGKAHPDDQIGKGLVRTIGEFVRRPDVRDRMIFLQDYDMVLANHMTSGVDVWLNNPRRPAEACGTSGMKVLVNGGLNLSILDGWWDEAYSPEVGWQLGDGREHHGEGDAAEADQLYRILENEVVPTFYDRNADGIPRHWIGRVRASMMQLTPQFSSERMVRDYAEQVYLPAARAVKARADAGVRAGINRWFDQVNEGWSDLRFGDQRVSQNGDRLDFEVQVYLGSLPQQAVRVELYCEPENGAAPAPVFMSNSGPIPGTVNGFTFHASVPARRPADHYTPRIVPFHEHVCVPMEMGNIHWRSR
ncbi:MAG: alpha-glucan family phosphorylase [Planctomycetota bacterium]|nr:alpha-glucan family phosphorylase [Planctomycetota bacterium]